MAKFNDLRRDRPRKNLGFDRNNVLTKKQGRRWKNFINHQFFAASMKFRFLECLFSYRDCGRGATHYSLP